MLLIEANEKLEVSDPLDRSCEGVLLTSGGQSSPPEGATAGVSIVLALN